MRIVTFTLTMLAIPTISASPYDGVYSLQESDVLEQIEARYEQNLISDFFVHRFSITYISIKEREDGKIALLKRNSTTGKLQGFMGILEDNDYTFINVFNPTEYSFLSDEDIQVESEEIHIEFDRLGNGLYSHTLVVSGEFFYTGVRVPDDGRVILLSAEQIIQIDAAD